MTAPLSKLLLKLPSVLSHDTAASCIESLREQCVQFFAFDASSPSQGAFTVEVDASGVAHFDSSALALLSELKRVVLSFQGQLTLVQVPTAMVRLAQVYGVAELLMPSLDGPMP